MLFIDPPAIYHLRQPGGDVVAIMEVDMPYWKKLIDEMTPEERFNRVVEILTRASVRLLAKQKAEAAGEQNVPLPEAVGNKRLNFASPEVPGHAPRRGRIRFGLRKHGDDRKTREIELLLIKDIQRLSVEGLSSEAIAQRLNKEDTVSKRAGKWSRTAVWRILKAL